MNPLQHIAEFNAFIEELANKQLIERTKAKLLSIDPAFDFSKVDIVADFVSGRIIVTSNDELQQRKLTCANTIHRELSN